MQNAKTSFALDDNGKIFDYATSKQLDPDGIYATASGVCYDMAVLKVQIQRGFDIDEAIVGRVPATGEAHWVFEGEPLNEVSVRNLGDAEARGLREQIEALKSENDSLQQQLSRVDIPPAPENEQNIEEVRRMASAGEPLIDMSKDRSPAPTTETGNQTRNLGAAQTISEEERKARERGAGTFTSDGATPQKEGEQQGGDDTKS